MISWWVTTLLGILQQGQSVTCIKVHLLQSRKIEDLSESRAKQIKVQWRRIEVKQIKAKCNPGESRSSKVRLI
jgi:hypothetical protein